MGQDKIVVRLAQRQLIEQAVFALAQCVDSTPHRRAALPDIEVESFSKAVLILQPHAVAVPPPTRGEMGACSRVVGATELAATTRYTTTYLFRCYS